MQQKKGSYLLWFPRPFHPNKGVLEIMPTPTLHFNDSHPESLRELAASFATGYRREISEYLLLHKAVDTEEVKVRITKIIDLLLHKDEILLDRGTRSGLIEICVMNQTFFSPQPHRRHPLFQASLLVVCFLFLAIYYGHLAGSIIMGFLASSVCFALIFASIFYILRRESGKRAQP
jgi:hypothetical protein